MVLFMKASILRGKSMVRENLHSLMGQYMSGNSI